MAPPAMEAELHGDVPVVAARRLPDRARRVATAAIALPLGAAAAWVGGPAWNLALAAAGGVAAFEYSRLVFGRVTPAASPGVAATAALPLLPAAFAGSLVAAAAAGFWLIAGAAVIAWMLQIAPQNPRRSPPGATEAVGHILAGILFAGPGLFALAALRAETADGRAWAIAILLVTWSNQVGAYAVGRALGHHRLARSLGPGKTWEGALGGALASLAATALVQAALLPDTSVVELAALTAGSAIIWPLADLARTALVRAHRVAGPGHLLPGTGGLLGRIDALAWNGLLIAAVAAIGAA